MPTRWQPSPSRISRWLVGVPVLQEYFQCLLPRWHGEPGDLKAACDWLRQQTGRDDAYFIMADLAIDAEGSAEVLNPDHPAHVDWKRVVQSYLAAAKEHRTSPHWAHVLLWDAYRCDQRTAAKALVPFLPPIDSLSSNEEPVCLIGAREWAEGKADLVAWDDRKYRFKTIGSKRQKSSSRARMGVAVEVNKPLMFGNHLALFVQSPRLTTRQGFPYEECVVIQDLMPRGDLKTELVFAPGRQEELLPGTYRLVLYAEGKVVHQATFELTP